MGLNARQLTGNFALDLNHGLVKIFGVKQLLLVLLLLLLVLLLLLLLLLLLVLLLLLLLLLVLLLLIQLVGVSMVFRIHGLGLVLLHLQCLL